MFYQLIESMLNVVVEAIHGIHPAPLACPIRSPHCVLNRKMRIFRLDIIVHVKVFIFFLEIV